ncbi:MAG: LacI family DNA-binding transcriptional regulator [Truepera sp.]|nr:LacI family DNA-binding transcriptional regulator [Truepera sp.]
MPTINDVAKLAGVSPTTAKRAIRDPARVATLTLARVRQAISALNYEPDLIATALRRGHSNTIGLVVGNIVEPFFAELTRAIAYQVRLHGYNLIIADNEYRTDVEAVHLKQFFGQKVRGLLLRSGYGESNLDYLQRMSLAGIAIVEIDRFYPDSPYSHVMLDNRQCVFDGVRYLRELGHELIAPLGTFDEVINNEERSLLFPEAMRHVGLNVPAEYAKVIRFDESEGYQLTHYLLDLEPRPTALFSLTGNLAQGSFRAIRERGLLIPQDISLLTFDNYPWTRLVTPPIDVIEQPVQEMGRKAVEILFSLMEHRHPDRIIRRRLPGVMIRRSSCAPPPAKAL